MHELLRKGYGRLHGLLPASLRRRIRRRYYRGIVANYTDADWEWSPVIRLLVPPGSEVLDIGANVGYLSGLFARWVGPSGRVVAVEPIPDTHDALAASMSTLFPGRVTVVQACVSDRPGTVTMDVPVGADGRENFYESRIRTGAAPGLPGARSFTVEAVTLDDLVARENLRPAFVKIDVEGHEETALRGASALLAGQPTMLIEVAGDPDAAGTPAHRLFGLLSSAGYQALTLEGGRCRPRRPGDRAIDYLFVSPPTAKKVMGEPTATR
jgi:FkbM family methyltransferase